jgi:hypothetical protein
MSDWGSSFLLLHIWGFLIWKDINLYWIFCFVVLWIELRASTYQASALPLVHLPPSPVQCCSCVYWCDHFPFFFSVCYHGGWHWLILTCWPALHVEAKAPCSQSAILCNMAIFHSLRFCWGFLHLGSWGIWCLAFFYSIPVTVGISSAGLVNRAVTCPPFYLLEAIL